MRIVAIALRNYKCYQGIHLIRFFSDDEKFIGLIGENGVGKSAVLQALNSFFTGQNWIRNKTGKKGESECGVAPIVVCDTDFLEKKKFSRQEIAILKNASNSIKKVLKLKEADKTIFISCMIFQNGNIGIFEGSQVVKDSQLIAKKIKETFLSYFKYIYIDAEVNINNSVDINSETFELIKGSGVVGDIEKYLKKVSINDDGKDVSISALINDRVVKYLDEEVINKLKKVDAGYNYKNLKTGAQSKMSEKLISELATKALFNNRELTKKIKNKNIGISDMSSGQRRKAFLDFVCVMIGNLDEEIMQRTILAIDEPEISVDASSKIQQFEKLRHLSSLGVSVIFTTHWYGWIIQLIKGSSILIKENIDGRKIYQSSIYDFSNLEISDIQPYEMRMIFDFLSSLGSWAENEVKQKFIICEGRTDFNYLNTHFKDANIKVIPTRGNEVIRLYKIFADYYWRGNNNPSNISFLIDTDPDKSQLLKDLTSNNLKRISRDNNGKVEIVANGNNIAEKCEIEDLLSPRPLLSALKKNSDMLNEEGRHFINSLSVKYRDQTGLRAFGLDDVSKIKFKKAYRGDYKLKVSKDYQPDKNEEDLFKSFFKNF